MTHAEQAREYFLKGYNCSQAVFAAFCDETKLDKETALKLASSFGGGMGKMREVCGACSGMFMVAGLLYGPADGEFETKAAHYAFIQDMANRFKQRNTFLRCKDLLGGLKTDTLPTPQKRTEQYYKQRPCLRFVEDACNILDQIIQEQNEKA